MSKLYVMQFVGSYGKPLPIGLYKKYFAGFSGHNGQPLITGDILRARFYSDKEEIFSHAKTLRKERRWTSHVILYKMDIAAAGVFTD